MSFFMFVLLSACDSPHVAVNIYIQCNFYIYVFATFFRRMPNSGGAAYSNVIAAKYKDALWTLLHFIRLYAIASSAGSRRPNESMHIVQQIDKSENYFILFIFLFKK